MSAEEVQGRVLSKEELDALLNELAESRREEDAQRGVFAPAALSQAQPIPFAPLRRALDRFASEYAKGLSSSYQKRIEWSTIGWDEVPLAELAEVLLPLDRVVVFALEPTEDLGYLVLSRPLLFGWMCLAYGGRIGSRPNPIPERPYTRIERRFLERIAGETLAEMERFVSELLPVRTRLVGIEEPRVLLESSERALLVNFDVQGFGDVGRVRLAFPLGPLARLDAPRQRVEARRRPSVRKALLDMQVPVRAEVGGAEVLLSHLAALREGELIPIEGSDDGTLLVRVGGAAKFRAVRGNIGRRLAVQVVERLD